MAGPQPSRQQALVVGEGSDMQINPVLWEQWNSDACDADDWKHGRVSNPYREYYDQIQWKEEHP